MMDFFKGTVTTKDWIAVGIIGALTVGLIVAFNFFLYEKQNQKFQGIQDTIADAEAELKRAEELDANIDTLRKETAEIEQLVEAFGKRLPSQREIPTLIQEFEGIAVAAAVSVEMKPLQAIQDERKETIPYEVVARGTFHQIADFINRMERYERYVRVSALNIGEEKQGASEASLTLSTYRFIEAGPGTSR